MRVPPPEIVAAAQASQHKYGILASTTLAQWACESAWGEKLTGTHNYFGVKAPAVTIPGRMCWTHEVVHGVSERVQCRFRDFGSVQAAFDYHAMLISLDHRYAKAMAVRSELEPYVRAMAAVYATELDYADELLGIIKGDELERFDLAAPAPVAAAAR